MKKQIAVPVDSSGVLDAHFGHCRFFALFQTDDAEIISEIQVTPPPHEPGLLPRWLAEQGVTDIIAGGMGQKAIQLFTQHGLNAIVGAPRLTARELALGYLNGSLQYKGNYCDH
jgi:predicted Fe-Mo cluster-binding NifX family protein